MSCIKIYPNPHFCIPLLQHVPRFSSRLPPTLAATNSVFFSQIKFLTWSKVFVGRTSKVSSNVLYTNTVIIVIMFGCVHPNLYRISQCFSKQLSESKSKYFPARYSTPQKIPQMLLRYLDRDNIWQNMVFIHFPHVLYLFHKFSTYFLTYGYGSIPIIYHF